MDSPTTKPALSTSSSITLDAFPTLDHRPDPEASRPTLVRSPSDEKAQAHHDHDLSTLQLLMAHFGCILARPPIAGWHVFELAAYALCPSQRRTRIVPGDYRRCQSLVPRSPHLSNATFRQLCQRVCLQSRRNCMHRRARIHGWACPTCSPRLLCSHCTASFTTS